MTADFEQPALPGPDELATVEVERAEPARPPRPMEPVSASERIDVIDILRGMALFGILIANMRGFSGPAELYGGYGINRLFPSNLDWISQAIETTVFQGKFITLFSFLFGLGFAVQMTRAMERGRSVSFYPRRLAILMGIGFVHVFLIWFGDILVSYAMVGFLLFLFRNSKQKTVAIWSISLLCSTLLLYTGFFIASFFGVKPPGGPDDPAKFQKTLEHAISVFRDGGYWAATQMRWHYFKEEYFGPGTGFLIALILPRFLAGLWVFRSGILQNPEPFIPKVKKIALWGLSIGLVCDAITLVVEFIIKPPQKGFPTSTYIALLARDISWVSIAAFYASSVFLLTRSAAWKARLAPFAAVGRMALTNYLLESIICTWFFRLTHTFGSVSPTWDYVATIALFSAQIPFSVWWLNRYQFGPAEWLWRSLTYGKRQPMRRAQAIQTHLAAEAAGA